MGIITLLTGATWAAWGFLLGHFVCLLWIDSAFRFSQNLFWKWGGRSLSIFFSGIFPAFVNQIQVNFSDEEFFAAVQAFFVMALWIIFRVASDRAQRVFPRLNYPGLRLRLAWLIILLLLALPGFVAAVFHFYQRSFYPAQAPAYPGITSEQPFVCGTAPVNQKTFSGSSVFQQILKSVENNPGKSTPEYGMLALGTGSEAWALLFHDQIMGEATREDFAGPANSMKSQQYDAALRIYYYVRVVERFPDLFSADDRALILDWFSKINRRSLSAEWVDWMYAAAFSTPVNGPYANQEIGAGLLSLIEFEGLASEALTAQNTAYLRNNLRGWQERFRNNDDSFIYQLFWITNAYFQSLYDPEINPVNMRNAFEWLMIQALPNGNLLGYNHPVAAPLAGTSYLGARLLNDGAYIWLAGNELEENRAEGDYFLPAQPGAEVPTDISGTSPDVGSCLIYGETGLPTQKGVLAPDKIVFRSGWSSEDQYLLLNLRFSGWHRYKATNSIILYDDGDPILEEDESGESFQWLPVGRSHFRDKRIPRENLNGLLIENQGLSAVLFDITGVGSHWMQDPPFYARVEQFSTGAKFDTSRTVMDDWHGWKHERTVYFYHPGPVVIIDQIQGPVNKKAALAWHLNGQVTQNDHGEFNIGGNSGQTSLKLASPDIDLGTIETSQDGESYAIQIPTTGGKLLVASVLLSGDWKEGWVNFEPGETGFTLSLWNESERIEIPVER